MFISERKVSGELSFLRALSFRSRLLEKDGKKLSVLERGFLGECIYDDVFDEVGHSSLLVFRDLYLEIEDSIAQYDTLIVSDGEIVVNEIKNFSGFYRFENGSWYKNDYRVPENPEAQLTRSVNKLRRLSYSSRLDFEVSGKLIFPHIEFRLHSDKRELWDFVVLRSGLKDYLKGFKNSYAGSHAEKIADAVSGCVVKNPYFNRSAEFESVKKGLYCGDCGSFELSSDHFYMKCCHCGSLEKKETHLIRAFSDFKSLFLNERMTKKKLREFIDYKISNSTAQRILNKYCKKIDNGAHTYYEYEHHDFQDAYTKYEKTYRYKDRRRTK